MYFGTAPADLRPVPPALAGLGCDRPG